MSPGYPGDMSADVERAAHAYCPRCHPDPRPGDVITALCGGVFGLLGGWLTDRFGRKTVMAAAIFLYSFSPFAAAYSTSLGWFIFFRSTTFIVPGLNAGFCAAR